MILQDNPTGTITMMYLIGIIALIGFIVAMWYSNYVLALSFDILLLMMYVLSQMLAYQHIHYKNILEVLKNGRN